MSIAGTRATFVILVLVGMAGSVISAVGSWIPSLGADEVVSAISATRTFPSLMGMLGHVDAVHGFYYVALHEWIAVLGRSDFALRLPSAIGVGVAAVGIALLFLRMGRTRLALTAAIVFIVIPRTTFMGMEARSYSWTAAFACWLVVVVLELIRNPNRRRGPLLVAYGVLLAVGTYLFMYTALMALVAATLVWRSPHARSLRPAFAVTSVVSLVTTLPVAIFAVLERAQVGHLGQGILRALNNVFVAAWFTTPVISVVCWALIVIAVSVEIRRPAWATLPSAWTFAIPWMVIPTVVLATSGLFIADFTARYLSFCTPAVAILIAAALDVLAHRRVVLNAAAVAVIAAVMVPVYISGRGPYAKNGSDLREVSAAARGLSGPGDAVMFDESTSASKDPRLSLNAYPAGFAGLRDVSLKTPYSLITSWKDAVLSAQRTIDTGRLANVRRIWLVEYKHKGRVDSYGLQALECVGFTVQQHSNTHRTRIYEVVRDPSARWRAASASRHALQAVLWLRHPRIRPPLANTCATPSGRSAGDSAPQEGAGRLESAH